MEIEDALCLSGKMHSAYRNVRHLHVDNWNIIEWLISEGRLTCFLYICFVEQREQFRTTWTISKLSGVAFSQCTHRESNFLVPILVFGTVFHFDQHLHTCLCQWLLCVLTQLSRLYVYICDETWFHSIFTFIPKYFSGELISRENKSRKKLVWPMEKNYLHELLVV